MQYFGGIGLINIDFGAGSGVDAEIREYDELVVGNHMSRVEFGILEFVETFQGLFYDWISCRTN